MLRKIKKAIHANFFFFAPKDSIQQLTLMCFTTFLQVQYTGTKEYKCICEGFSPSGKKETPTTKATITGLYPATLYTFVVFATTKCGDGKESNAVSIKTKTGGEIIQKQGRSHNIITEGGGCTSNKTGQFIAF